MDPKDPEAPVNTKGPEAPVYPKDPDDAVNHLYLPKVRRVPATIRIFTCI